MQIIFRLFLVGRRLMQFRLALPKFDFTKLAPTPHLSQDSLDLSSTFVCYLRSVYPVISSPSPDPRSRYHAESERKRGRQFLQRLSHR